MSAVEDQASVSKAEDATVSTMKPSTGSTKGLLLKRKDFLDADDSSKSYTNRTYYFKRNEDLDGIIDTCSKKLLAEPQNLRALYLRGTSYMKKGTLDLAIRDLSFVINKQPDHVESLYSRGMTFSKMGKPELAIPDLTLVLKLNPDHVNAAFARAACYNSMGLLTQAIEDYNFALFKDQTLNSPIREDSSTNAFSATTRNRTWSAASNSILDSPFTPKPKDSSFSVGFSPAGSISGSEPFSSSKRLDVDATGIFSLYGVASPTIGSNRQIQRSITPSSDIFTSDAYAGESPRPGSALSTSSSSTPLTLNLPRSAPSHPASNTSTFKSLTQFRSQQQKDDEGSSNSVGSLQADKHHAAAYEFRKQGNYAAAIEEYSNALAHDSKHFKSLFNRGFAYDKVGQFQQAIQDYSLAIEINPEYAFCYYNRGISYDHMGDLPAALKDFSKALSLQSNNADFYHNRAYVYRKLQQWNDAIEDYTSILRFAPQNFKALFNRSLCYERKDQIKEAMNDIEAALQLQPQHGGCFAHRAMLFEKLEDNERAIADYTSALMNGAQAFPTLSSRARIYTKIGKFDLAISDFSTCLEMQPDDLPTLFSRATTFKSAQKLREAVSDFSKVLSILQDSSSSQVASTDPSVIIAQQVLAFNQRGYCFRKMDLIEEAIRDYSSAIRLAPDQLRAYNNRGFLFAKCNRFEEAIADYTKAIQLDPQNAYAYHNRGISYDKLGLIDQAIADFGKVFELDSKQSLLVNSGGNMNAMMSSMIPSSAIAPNLTGPSSNMSVDANHQGNVFADAASFPITRPNSALSMASSSAINRDSNNAGTPAVINGNAAANPLTKLSLRQQAQGRSKTPTSIGSAQQPPSLQQTANATSSQLPQINTDPSPTNQNSLRMRSTSPSIIKRSNLLVSPKPVRSSADTPMDETTESNSPLADTSSSAAGKSNNGVTFALNIPPKENGQSAPAVLKQVFKNNQVLTIVRPGEEETSADANKSPRVSAAAIDEKLDTVAALLSKFGNSSAETSKPEVPSTSQPSSGRPSRLIAQPVPVVAKDIETSQLDDSNSPKAALSSQGKLATQAFGVKLRSTTPNATTNPRPVETDNGPGKEGVAAHPPVARPRFFRDPVPQAAVPNTTEANVDTTKLPKPIVNESAEGALPPSVAAPINAAMFLAKLRESRQEEAKLLLQSQGRNDNASGGAAAAPAIRPSFGSISTQSTTSSGKFSQMYS